MIEDAAGKSVRPGDWLLEDRGKVWQALPTDPTFLKERLVKVVKGVGHTYLHIDQVFLINEATSNWPQQELRKLWESFYEKYCRISSRQAISDRRRSFQESLAKEASSMDG